MLAIECPMEELATLQLPLYASYKYDGIRATSQGGKAISRTGKEIPNREIQKLFKSLPDGMDGELVIVDDNQNIVEFEDIESQVMSRDGGIRGFRYIIFDWCNSRFSPFRSRQAKLIKWWMAIDIRSPWVIAEQRRISLRDDLDDFLQSALDQGYEGVCTRYELAGYKFGRSTINEQCLVKIKPWQDAEATIIGWRPLLKNENIQERNELGYAKRSKAKAGLKEEQLLGVIKVRWENIEFEIGTGFSFAQRKQYFHIGNGLFGMQITFQYRGLTKKGIPKHASFRHFRIKGF